MPVDGVYISPQGKKTFIPLENNPAVFTSLAHNLGLSKDLEFYDIFGLDEDALAHIPRPAKALIFISPPAMYTIVRSAGNTPMARDGLTYDKTGDDEPVVWSPQTIGNACGLMALLHGVANGAREDIAPGSVFDRVIKEMILLKPLDRAAVIYNSDELEEAHMREARRGDTAAPQAQDHAAHHFIAFSKGKDGHLWELEGITNGPVDRGALKEDEDVLSEAALDQGVKLFLNASMGEYLDFSIIALAPKSN